MLIITLLFNFLFLLTESRRRYRSGGRAAGINKVTETFGKGVAALIKDVKEGTWGEQEYPQYDEKKGNRFIDRSSNQNSIPVDTTFYVIVVVTVVLIVVLILYYLIKVMPQYEQRDVRDDMKRRHTQRYQHYEAIKMIAETGIHPDKAYGRLQKITYKEKKTF